jgi:GNAT superfamily N-acetyltransferase
MSHPLDNPVWESLTSHHAALARRKGGAARYPADIAPFVGVDINDVQATVQLASLVDIGESILFVGPPPPLPLTRWNVDPVVFIAQMTRDSLLPVNDGPMITPLSSQAHVADMLALTTLVYPHYFRPRTIEMGRYFGIYDGDTLAAMAGERMRFGDYQEISAICTHPNYTGRGYAQRLTAKLTNDILGSGRHPILHVSHQNTRAKSLYQRMGFRFRADIPLLAAKRVAK